MNSIRLSLLAAALAWLTAGTSTADVVVLQPVDDATIGTYLPDAPGNSSQLVLEGWISGYIYRPLLKFDLSSIPDGWVVLSAELTLLHNLWHGNSTAVFPTEIWRMPSDNWSEATVTWNSCDQTGGVAVAMRQPQATNWNVLEPWAWNIRLADWNYAGDLLDDAVTFATRWSEENNQWWKFTGFSSKEGAAAPTLRIEFVPRLTITRTNELILVSWTGPAAGWLLETTNALNGASAPWSVVPPPYQTSGDTLSMTFTNLPAVGNQFFRLHKP